MLLLDAIVVVVVVVVNTVVPVLRSHRRAPSWGTDRPTDIDRPTVHSIR